MTSSLFVWASIRAEAFPATGSSTCEVGRIVSVFPSAGEIPPDTVFLAEVEGCGVPLVELEDGSGGATPLFAQGLLGGWHLLAEVELPPGPGELVVYPYEGAPEVLAEVTVVEGATLPPVGEPAELEVSAERRCGSALATDVTVIATFEEPGAGDVVLSVRTENGVTNTFEVVPIGTVTLPLTVDGGSELCVSVAATAPDGTPLWQTEDACAEPFEGCPTDLREDAGGCGCDGVGGGVGWLAAVLAGLVVRRR